jgi:hypothetical protein
MSTVDLLLAVYPDIVVKVCQFDVAASSGASVWHPLAGFTSEFCKHFLSPRPSYVRVFRYLSNIR